MIFACPEFQLEVLPECGSTNEELLGRRDLPSFHGAALLALRQTAGYGRRGREWQSGEGNLALSFAFRLESDLPVTILPFVAGLALVDVLRPLLSPELDLRLKWPNDLYLEGRKLSGLIAQARQSPLGADVVLGVGVNLREAPKDLGAVALAEFGATPAPESLARQLLARFRELALGLSGFRELKGRWEELARLGETDLLIVGEEGVVRGRELLETGELAVEGADGEVRRLSSETVSLRMRS
jgi:BirA family transcriptional regulator, biotin operon repressor / biotin---[acetyl-CoA-carboxylase] ligase